jgi:hypothetical protein
VIQQVEAFRAKARDVKALARVKARGLAFFNQNHFGLHAVREKFPNPAREPVRAAATRGLNVRAPSLRGVNCFADVANQEGARVCESVNNQLTFKASS